MRLTEKFEAFANASNCAKKEVGEPDLDCAVLIR